MYKFVSIIIPCRNEEKFMGKCLDSVLAQDYPSDQMEVLIADGMSTDNTRKILEGYAARDKRVRWFENQGKVVPPGLNLLIRNGRGSVVIRLDAHNTYPANYISLCVKYLFEHNVDNVGGVWETLPGSDTFLARAIAFSLTSPFGVGRARFRLGVKAPILVDTVPFGCYRRDVFDKVGLFNEKMVRNQDNEFNSRLIKAGGKILLHPEIKSSYHARPDLSSIASQHFRNGFWCIYGMKFSKNPFLPRHLVPLVFVLSLMVSFLVGLFFKPLLWFGLGIAGLYCAAMFGASVLLAIKHGIIFLPFFLIVFPVLHIPYGLGSLAGFWKLRAEG